MLSNDSIIADLYKRGYKGIRIMTFDAGQSYSITTAGNSVVRVSVTWDEDAAAIIASVLALKGLPVPASFTRPMSSGAAID